jgi:hypothetical protein
VSDQQPDIFDRAVELFVYAPVGFGQIVIEEVPPLLVRAVELGRETVTKQVVSARSTGQVAIAFGIPMLRKRLNAKVSALLTREGNVPAPSPPRVAAPVTTPVVEPPTPDPSGDAPAREELPIPGYDALSASQVVERLAGLERTEHDAVQAYESAHRQRRTILGKIEQLAG